MKYYLIPLLFALNACSLFPTKPIAIVQPAIVKIDPKVLELCLPLQELDPQNILQSLQNNILIYTDCASKQENSVKLLKEFGNIK